MGKFEYKGFSFLAVLYQIARNKIIDYHRQNKKRNGVIYLSSPLSSDFQDKSSPFDSVEHREQLERILRKAELTYRQEQVLYLRVIAGFSIKEAAEILHIEEGVVKLHAYNAKTRLRQVAS